MESITEVKLLNKILLNKNKNINDSSTFHKTRNIKKFSSSIFTNSSQPNIPHNLLQKNNSSPKFSIIKINPDKNPDTKITDEIRTIKEELLKKDKSKYNTLKLKSLKKSERSSVKSIKRRSTIFNQEENERQIKSPRTIFQKILVNINKLKTRTNKTIEVMKKNLKVTKEEIKMRREQERQMKILSATIYMQNSCEKKNKKNKKNFFNFKFNNTNSPNLHQSLYITSYKKNNANTNNKNTSNFLPNISTNNNSNTYNNNYNQSISNGSTSLVNYINDTNNINTNTNYNNNLSSSLNVNTEQKTSNKKLISSLNKNNNNQANSTKNKSKNKKDISGLGDSNEQKKLSEIPEMNLSSINSVKILKPLFPKEKHKKVYKNMYHYRNLVFSILIVRKQLYKLYGMPALLVEQTTFNSENDMNTLLLNNKIRLIQDNIDHFKINIMYKKDFFEAFNNMESYQKAEFNYNLEEISCVLIKTIPLILQNYYEIIKKLISIKIPNIKQERLKKPETESQCLNLNYAFFNSSTEYFNICLEVYRILSTKVNRFIYSITDFGPLNSYLDILRYCTNNLISMSSAHINKTKGDKKILDKMEIGLNIKKEEKKELDILERYHLRHKKQTSEWDLKIDRVKRALNMKKDLNDFDKNKKYFVKKIKIKESSSLPKKNTTAFNSPIFRDMMKYFKPEIKSKIIAMQVVDRFEKKKNVFNNYSDDENENEDGNTRKIYA